MPRAPALYAIQDELDFIADRPVADPAKTSLGNAGRLRCQRRATRRRDGVAKACATGARCDLLSAPLRPTVREWVFRGHRASCAARGLRQPRRGAFRQRGGCYVVASEFFGK